MPDGAENLPQVPLLVLSPACAPPPSLLPYSSSPPPLPLFSLTSSVIREQGPYKGASWEPGSSPSVQPHHQRAPPTLGAAPEPGPRMLIMWTHKLSSSRCLSLFLIPLCSPSLFHWKKIYHEQANSSCFNKAQTLVNIKYTIGRNRQHCSLLLTKHSIRGMAGAEIHMDKLTNAGASSRLSLLITHHVLASFTF